MSSYTEFYDITGTYASSVPLVSGTYVGYYVTGSGGIEETAAQIAAAKAAGMGVITIDQTTGLSLFAAGQADVADIEDGAGTPASAETAITARRALGITQHTLYVSQDSWANLEAAIADPTGVVYWIADYDDSEVAAEDFIAANSAVVAVQFGDPTSNPTTVIPGTDVSLATAQADIDVGLSSWLSQFMPEATMLIIWAPDGAYLLSGGRLHGIVDQTSLSLYQAAGVPVAGSSGTNRITAAEFTALQTDFPPGEPTITVPPITVPNVTVTFPTVSLTGTLTPES